MSDRSLLEKVVGRANRMSASLVRTRTVRMVNEQPIVSFAFDDFPKSAVEVAGTMLEQRGAAGTYYLSRTFAGATVEGIEYYDLADVRRLIDNGHEIGCHTASHSHVPQLSRAKLVEEIKANAEFLRENFGDLRMTTFAYPFGDMDLPSKLYLQSRFAACRSNLPGSNSPVADLGALRSQALYSRSITASAVAALVRQWAKPRSWLILYTHDVSDDPSPFGCTPALFEFALNAALDAGARVIPIRNALGPIRYRELHPIAAGSRP
jgi:peptidoglycan/xylan/chitin deacetylase (PgdA/CDA1 family)